MSPVRKLPHPPRSGNEKHFHPECPYCGFKKCWKHGKYERKGFHGRSSASQDGIVAVSRYLCRGSLCAHTFSVLPKGVVPYCRFLLDELIDITRKCSEGKSAYWIARKQWNISLRVILRTVLRIKKVTIWLAQLYQELTGSVENSFQNVTRLLQERLSWFRLTRMWFHHFYPRRTGYIINPHNLDSNCF